MYTPQWGGGGGGGGGAGAGGGELCPLLTQSAAHDDFDSASRTQTDLLYGSML